jgi:pterin-4a-carbinolamine dehydratase
MGERPSASQAGAPLRQLSAEALRARMPALPGWSLVDGQLERTLRFGDFQAAFGFVTAVALAAEAMKPTPRGSTSPTRCRSSSARMASAG